MEKIVENLKLVNLRYTDEWYKTRTLQYSTVLILFGPTARVTIQTYKTDGAKSPVNVFLDMSGGQSRGERLGNMNWPGQRRESEV